MLDISKYIYEYKKGTGKAADEKTDQFPELTKNFVQSTVDAEEEEFEGEIVSFNRCFLYRFWQRFFILNRFTKKGLNDPGLKYWAITPIISEIKKLYKNNHDAIFDEEAWELYKFMMRHTQEQYRFRRLLAKKAPWQKFKLWSQEIFLWIFDLLSEFGVNGPRIILSSGVIVLFFGTIFSIFKLIGHTPYLPEKLMFANTWDCFYYSLVTLLSLGSEVLYPAKPVGMILEAFEALLGWLLLGILLTYVTKHIK